MSKKKKILIGVLFVVILLLATHRDFAIDLLNFFVGLIAIIFGYTP